MRKQFFRGRVCLVEERAGAGALRWNKPGDASRMVSGLDRVPEVSRDQTTQGQWCLFFTDPHPRTYL